jgi:hypothetical protein
LVCDRSSCGALYRLQDMRKCLHWAELRCQGSVDGKHLWKQAAVGILWNSHFFLSEQCNDHGEIFMYPMMFPLTNISVNTHLACVIIYAQFWKCCTKQKANDEQVVLVESIVGIHIYLVSIIWNWAWARWSNVKLCWGVGGEHRWWCSYKNGNAGDESESV